MLYHNTILFGSQRGFTFERADELIDVTDKASRDKTYIAGKRGVVFTLDQFYVEGDGRYSAMQSAYESTGNAVTLTIYDNSSGSPVLRHSGGGRITSLSVNATSNEAAVVSMTVESDNDVWS